MQMVFQLFICVCCKEFIFKILVAKVIFKYLFIELIHCDFCSLFRVWCNSVKP